MKSLKDLKEEILAGKLQKFYVFCGEDNGLRKHYIDEIAKHYQGRFLLPSVTGFVSNQTGSSLFVIKNLYIAHGDVEFAKAKKLIIEDFLRKLKDDTVILCFDEELPTSTLFKEFDEYITLFPCVQDKIAEQFIDMEVSLTEKSKEEMCFNCGNNYGNILLEADKIRNYAQAKGISQQEAYNVLEMHNQLLVKYETFHSYQLMDDILKGNKVNFAAWYEIIKHNFLEEFWIAMESIMNDFQIAYLIKKFGRIDGSNRAYGYGLNWGRVKAIRDYVIAYEENDLIEKAYEVSKLDAKIKFGVIEKEKLLDYFFCLII